MQGMVLRSTERTPTMIHLEIYLFWELNDIGIAGDEEDNTGKKTENLHSGGETSQLQVDEQVELLKEKAASLYDKKDYAAERQTLLKALELAPEDPDTLVRLGRAYRLMGSYDKAMEMYRKAEELDPNMPSLYCNIGVVLNSLGQYAEAKEQYEKAIAMMESNSYYVHPDGIPIFYGNYALCLGKLGDKKNAKKYLSIAKQKGYDKECIDSICKEIGLFRFLI